MTADWSTLSRIPRLLFLTAMLVLNGLGALALQAQTAQTPSQDTPDSAATEPDASDGDAAQESAAPERPAPLSVPQQYGDDVLEPLDPVRPRTEAESRRLEALAWYMTGKLRETRGDPKGALEAFEQAVELDPDAVEAYRDMVPLAFSLNRSEDAVRYALKALELDPNDYQLLRQVGVFMIRQNKLDEAISLLEQAVNSETLDHASPMYVTLHRDLAILYSSTDQAEEAAESYEVVFDALRNSEKYKLDSRMRRGLRDDPATAYERMGDIFLQAGKTDLAVEAYQEAAQSDSAGAKSISYNLAQVYVKREEYDKAREELQKYFDAQLRSKGADAYRLLAEILRAQDREDEVIPALQSLAEKDPRNNTLAYFLARELIAAEKLDAAEELLKKTLEGNEDGEAYLGLIAIYREQNRPAELLQALTQAARAQVDPVGLAEELQAIADNADLARSLIRQGQQLPDADDQLGVDGFYILAKVAAASEQDDAAVELYGRALALRPNREKAMALFNEFSLFLLQLERYGKAAEVLRDATEFPSLRSERPAFLYQLALALELDHQTEAALTAIGEAQNLVPNNPNLKFRQAWILYHAHRWDEAIKQFDDLIRTFPNETKIVRQSQFSLSNIYVQQGDIRKGEEILESVLEEDPDDPSVNNDLGYLYADQGKKLEQAEQMIRKAVEAEPENPAYLDSMGWVLYRLERYQEAVTWLEKATQQEGGGDITIWDHLGDCYAKLDQTEKAVDAWQKALEAGKSETQPDEELIKKIESKLEAAQSEEQ